MSLSSILIGLLAIFYGIVQLGTTWSMKIFWVGLIVFGAFKVIENFHPIVIKLPHRKATQPAQDQPSGQ